MIFDIGIREVLGAVCILLIVLIVVWYVEYGAKLQVEAWYKNG